MCTGPRRCLFVVSQLDARLIATTLTSFHKMLRQGTLSFGKSGAIGGGGGVGGTSGGSGAGGNAGSGAAGNGGSAGQGSGSESGDGSDANQGSPRGAMIAQRASPASPPAAKSAFARKNEAEFEARDHDGIRPEDCGGPSLADVIAEGKARRARMAALRQATSQAGRARDPAKGLILANVAKRNEALQALLPLHDTVRDDALRLAKELEEEKMRVERRLRVALAVTEWARQKEGAKAKDLARSLLRAHLEAKLSVAVYELLLEEYRDSIDDTEALYSEEKQRSMEWKQLYFEEKQRCTQWRRLYWEERQRRVRAKICIRVLVAVVNRERETARAMATIALRAQLRAKLWEVAHENAWESARADILQRVAGLGR